MNNYVQNEQRFSVQRVSFSMLVSPFFATFLCVEKYKISTN